MGDIIERLEDIMIDIATEDADGRTLWRRYFRGREFAPWDDFAHYLAKVLGVSPPSGLDDVQWNCLHAILAEKATGILGKGFAATLENFGRVIAWFGPLITPPGQLNFLEKVCDTVSQRWFHGNISQIEAEDRLQNQPKGTYLLRFSASSPGCYTISHINKKKKLVHQRVTHIPGEGFCFWDAKYADLRELIKHERKEQFFSQPCPGSQFQKLFPKKKAKDAVVEVGYVVPGRS